MRSINPRFTYFYLLTTVAATVAATIAATIAACIHPVLRGQLAADLLTPNE